MLRVELLASTHNLTSARTVELSFKPEDTLVAVKDKICAAMALRPGTTPDLRLQIRNPLTTLGGKDADSVVCLLFDKFEDSEQRRTGSHPRDGSGRSSASEDAEVFVDTRPGGAIELLVAEPGRVSDYLAEDATCAKLRLTPSTQLMVSNHSSLFVEGDQGPHTTGATHAGGETETVNLIVVEPSGTESIFVMDQTTSLQKLMHDYCNRKGISTNAVRFLFEGNRLNEAMTPQNMNMEDGDRVHVRREQMGGMMHPTSGRLNYEDLVSQRRRVTATPNPNPNPNPYPNPNPSPNHNQARDAALARWQHPGGRRGERRHLVLRAQAGTLPSYHPYCALLTMLHLLWLRTQAAGGCRAGARSGGQGGGRHDFEPSPNPNPTPNPNPNTNSSPNPNPNPNPNPSPSPSPNPNPNPTPFTRWTT